MRNIFLEKSYTKCCGEAISRPFSKKSNLRISPAGLILVSTGMGATFQKKNQKIFENGKIFENCSKNVLSVYIF